jgi:hypothetical protein
VFDSVRALRRSEASFAWGWSGMVEMEDVVEAILDIDGQEDRALIFSSLSERYEERGFADEGIVGKTLRIGGDQTARCFCSRENHKREEKEGSVIGAVVTGGRTRKMRTCNW